MERLALEQFHDEEALVVVASNVVERADVRVIERGNRARLAVEARFGLRIADVGGRRNLVRDVAVEARVFRAIHLAHSAFAQFGHDLIRTEGLADHRRGLGWRRDLAIAATEGRVQRRRGRPRQSARRFRRGRGVCRTSVP